MNSLKYLAVYIVPILIFHSLDSRGIYTYTAIIVLFFVIPAMELILKSSNKNMESIEEDIAKKNKIYDFIVYSMLPIQYGLMFFYLYNISYLNLDLYEKLGMMTAFGLSCGILGINVAHELGHRSTWYEQWMAKLLLLSSQYMHFYIEHNKGHHKHVSTDLDPASSKYGENIYSFLFRSIKDSWFSAWDIEKERLSRVEIPFWSWKNEMFQFQLLQLGLVIFIGLFFGVESLLYYIGSISLGIILLEAVNYIQHYGLRRKQKGEESFERTLPIHSWNSNKPIGRLFLFELTRHSDHHYMTNRPYQILRHFDESPQMPTGYPGMMLLAFLPPLWFKVVHKVIADYKATEAGAALA